jgi:hypothetical protein
MTVVASPNKEISWLANWYRRLANSAAQVQPLPNSEELPLFIYQSKGHSHPSQLHGQPQREKVLTLFTASVIYKSCSAT